MGGQAITDQATQSAARPPKPRLALAVGVIGHRPNRLPAEAVDAVRAEVERVLEALKAALAESGARYRTAFAAPGGAPEITLLTGLAEGADRMAAEQAQALGLAQSAVLAFPAEEFERDFETPASRKEFNDLLGKAKACLALPGERAEADRAYEQAGIAILDNADILLAIWDGGPSAGRGGTTEMLERAAKDNIPIIHVDARAKQATRVIWSGLAHASISSGMALADLAPASIEDSLPAVVEALVRPPSDPEEAAKLATFTGEKWRPRNYHLVVPLLLWALGVRRPRGSDHRPPGPDALAAEFRASGLGMLDGAGFEPVARAYGWADGLGVRYAQIFRSAYIANFGLAALAVLLAAGSLIGKYILHLPKTGFLWAELVCIASVLMITMIGRRRDWHGRWMESREVAERLRMAMPLWLLGQRASRFSGEEPAWTGWYVRAHLRALGLASAALTPERLAEVKELLKTLVAGQCRYHGANTETMGKVERRLEGFGEVAFFATFLVAGAYLGVTHFGIHPSDSWSITVTALTAGLPALGAASYGVRLIGDFEGIAARSERTGATLEAIGAALEAHPPELAPLRAAAQAASATMLGDVASWRLSSETRKLAIPC